MDHLRLIAKDIGAQAIVTCVNIAFTGAISKEYILPAINFSTASYLCGRSICWPFSFYCLGEHNVFVGLFATCLGAEAALVGFLIASRFVQLPSSLRLPLGIWHCPIVGLSCLITGFVIGHLKGCITRRNQAAADAYADAHPIAQPLLLHSTPEQILNDLNRVHEMFSVRVDQNGNALRLN